jgi:hypothetical protein
MHDTGAGQQLAQLHDRYMMMIMMMMMIMVMTVFANNNKTIVMTE